MDIRSPIPIIDIDGKSFVVHRSLPDVITKTSMIQISPPQISNYNFFMF